MSEGWISGNEVFISLFHATTAGRYYCPNAFHGVLDGYSRSRPDTRYDQMEMDGSRTLDSGLWLHRLDLRHLRVSLLRKMSIKMFHVPTRKSGMRESAICNSQPHIACAAWMAIRASTPVVRLMQLHGFMHTCSEICTSAFCAAPEMLK